MKVNKVIEELNYKYPDKNIIVTEGEILCEIDPTSEHSDYSIAIAVIDKSQEHYHKQTKETYRIISGTAELHIDDQTIILEQGDEFTIPPNRRHFVVGNETWIECKSKPGWRKEDHILV